MAEFGMNLKAFKEGFFDQLLIKDQAHREKVKIIRRLGAYTMRVARRSMRRRKGASSPGTPPNAHVGLIKDLVLFAAEKDGESGVVGPAIISGGGVVPRLMEEGGQIAGKDKSGTPCVFNYPPRAYMAPALAIATKNLADIWG